MTDENVVSLYPLWREALKAFHAAGFRPGEMLRFAWLYDRFGLQMPGEDMPYGTARKIHLQFLSQFKNFENVLLLDHQIALRNHKGIGYEIVPANEQTEWAFADGVKTVRKELRKMSKRLLNVNHAQLTSDERRANADALAKMAMLSGMAQRVTKQSLAELADESLERSKA